MIERETTEHDSVADLRESVQTAYSGKGSDYDFVRSDESGKLLGEYDIGIVQRMIPFDVAPKANNLEVGSGTGRFTVPFLRLGYNVTATDINDSLLQSLREKLAVDKQLENRCDVRVENGFSLSFADDSVDGLMCVHVVPRFETSDDQVALLTEFERVLKPGGRLLFNFSNKKSLLYGGLYREHLIAFDDILSALSKLELDIIDIEGKWLLNGSLLRKLPAFLRKPIFILDRMLLRFWNSRAWDVFLLVEKHNKA